MEGMATEPREGRGSYSARAGRAARVTRSRPSPRGSDGPILPPMACPRRALAPVLSDEGQPQQRGAQRDAADHVVVGDQVPGLADQEAGADRRLAVLPAQQRAHLQQARLRLGEGLASATTAGCLGHVSRVDR